MKPQVQKAALEKLQEIRTRVDDARWGANRAQDQNLSVHMLKTRELIDGVIKLISPPSRKKGAGRVPAIISDEVLEGTAEE